MVLAHCVLHPVLSLVTINHHPEASMHTNDHTTWYQSSDTSVKLVGCDTKKSVSFENFVHIVKSEGYQATAIDLALVEYVSLAETCVVPRACGTAGGTVVGYSRTAEACVRA